MSIGSATMAGRLMRGVARAGALAGLAVVCLCMVVIPGRAFAGEPGPIQISHFAFQTTRSAEVAGPLTHDNPGVANVPVPFTQAGGHPNGQDGGADALTATMEFEPQFVTQPNPVTRVAEQLPVPARDPRDIAIELPTGLLGNPTATPRCPLRTVTRYEKCPAVTQVGVIEVDLNHGEAFIAPVVNVEPEEGQSAEFAIQTPYSINYLITAHVIRTREEEGKQPTYGLMAVTNGMPMAEIYRIVITFWGVPSSRVHDHERGMVCTRGVQSGSGWGCNNNNGFTGNQASGAPEIPFLTMPSDCAVGPETAVMKADSWEEPGHVGLNGSYEGYAEAKFTMPGVTGCSLLGFEPGLRIEPDTWLADEPVGLGVNLVVPQVERPDALAVPEMKRSVISFPLGMSVSPGVVDGIQACNETGREGINIEGAESEEPGLNGELQLAAGHCPDASIVGTAEAITPLLSEPIKGHVYLARPGCGNTGLGQRECTVQDALDGNLYQLYLELGGTGPLADTGVNIKVRLKTEANPATGQLTAVADEIAQLPFSELKVDLNGGPRAPIDNPAVCGQALTTADFTPWAAPGTTPQGVFMGGLGDATPSSFYEVQGCQSPQPFDPGFVAGTVIPNAGKFSAFTLDLSRKDREQYVKGIQVHTPPGLLGMLSNVPLCPEAQANAGSCPESSRIGTTRVASGAGSHPFEIEGAIYLTHSYRGAPFGLSIVTHAVAGPFNLGLVIVRARINVDPVDSSLTITTDETGPYAIPQIIFGVPLRLQRITVDVNRPDFMFNPTNCKAQQITAVISGTGQTVASVASPFAVGNCTSLAFKPVFRVSTSGRASRKSGATLDAKLSYPKSALNKDANIARVKVALPKQLPSWLGTLQKACPAATFQINPAQCPPGATVGVARATTPLLPVSLSGPVYFVSHGGEEFPSLIVVLQGYGVRVDLTGSTFIRNGITSSTFKTIPDVPVNTFELYLPEGQNHALAANGNLCEQHAKLVMPTEFTAQNGATFKQNTKITVTGCTKAKHKRSRRARKPGSRPAHASTNRRARR